MQERIVDGLEGTEPTRSKTSDRLLEDSRDLIIESRGVPAATLSGRLHQYFRQDAGGPSFLVYQYQSLRWSDVAAQLLLQGASVQSILGSCWLLVGGTHRPAYDPRPGVDQPVLVEVLSNPGQLSALELIKLVTG
jgi:hypothetical protein